MRIRRTTLLSALVALLAGTACQGTSPPPPVPVASGPPAIADAQPVVDAPLFLGQNAFASPLANQSDYTPALATVRADGGNSGVFDGPAPLGRAPVTGSAVLSVLPPLLWAPAGLTTGCQMEVTPGVTKVCLAAIDASTLTVISRWSPPGQDLVLSGAVVDDSGRVVVTTRQRHVLVVARPDAEGPFRVVRDIDLSSHLSDRPGLGAALPDANGNLWFTSGGPPSSGPAPPTGADATATATATVGFVTSDDQVLTTTLRNQQVATGLATDQGHVFLATVPAGSGSTSAATGYLYDLVAAGGQLQIVWRASYDAGTAAKSGPTTPGGAPPVLVLGSQYLALTDNADAQTNLLVFLRGTRPAGHGTTTTTALTTATTTTATTTTVTTTTVTTTTATTATTTPATTTTNPAPATTTSIAPTTSLASTTTSTPAGGSVSGDARLVCRVPLFNAGASTVTTAPIGYSSGDTNSIVVANGNNTPAALAGPTDGGPANNMNQMPGGVTRVDVISDGSGCRVQWTEPLRLKTAPALSSTTGLMYGYTQDEARAAAGTYIWYFVAVDFRTGSIVWRQRAGAGSTKNDNGLPTVLGANGVLYQTVPLGLVWMRDVSQRP